MIRRRGRRVRIAHAGVRPLRVVPGELPVVHLRAQVDAFARIRWNLQPVVDGVGCARRNQPNVGHRPSHPGVPLVDRIAAAIELEAAVEVRRGIDRATSAVCRCPAVHEDAPVVVHCLELHPDIEGIDSAAREEMTDLPGADHHLHPDRFVPSNHHRPDVERRGHFRNRHRDTHPGAEAGRLLTHRERARQRRLGGAPRLRRRGGRSFDPRDAEDVDRHLPIAEELLHRAQLLFVSVDERQRRVRAREAVRPDESVVRCRIVRRDERHVATVAGLRRRRIVERARSLSRDAGRLPVVVLVEATDPAVVVHRDVEVHLVARRAEVGLLIRVEWLEERPAVRLGSELRHQIVRPAYGRELARGQVMQRGVLDDEVALPHRAADMDDGMARRAAQPGLRLRRIDLLAGRPVEPAVEEHRVVVAAGAPLRRLGADDVLHVLDRAAVPLVVERREMVRRLVPLVVDVTVTPAAHLARKEEVGRDQVARVASGRRREERRAGARPFVFHRHGRKLWVLDGVRRSPAGVVPLAQDRRQGARQRQYRDPAPNGPAADRIPSYGPPDVDRDEQRAGRRGRHMQAQEPDPGARRTRGEDGRAQQESRGAGGDPERKQGSHASARRGTGRRPPAPDHPDRADGPPGQAEGGMGENRQDVEKRGIRPCRERDPRRDQQREPDAKAERSCRGESPHKASHWRDALSATRVLITTECGGITLRG